MDAERTKLINDIADLTDDQFIRLLFLIEQDTDLTLSYRPIVAAFGQNHHRDS